jgi:ribA/ribD-fused uncharacterized protein
MINNLKGTYLSNFYEVPIRYKGLTYRNAEAAYQASKCADKKERNWFVDTPAHIAKAKGRKVKMRDDWNDVRLSIMWEILQAKFAQNYGLLTMLIETDDEEIQEGNTWNDKFWGVCNGEGMNHLGIMLMAIREEAR